MKRISIVLGLFLAAFLGCAAPYESAREPVTVTLIKEDTYRIADSYSYQTFVEQGGETRFVLYPETGFVITGTDYANGTVTEGAGGSKVLILKDVQYPARVRILCEPDVNIRTITYRANGGATADGDTLYTVHHALNGHLYPNTDNGASLWKEHCTLIGWNTAPDGSGERIGLGSRFRTDESGLTLYAEWIPWTDEAQFVFREESGSYTVTAYSGTGQTVAVPAEHNGLPVTGIEEGAFTGKRIALLSLPLCMERIGRGAFTGCVIDRFFFYDNVMSLPDEAFHETAYPEVHILAAQPPRYAGSGRASNYADKIDLLYRCRNDSKIVVFGGSGTYYSIVAAAMQREIGNARTVLNMGINGWFPAMPQLDVIRRWMRPGDILLHVPEMASGTQLFSDPRFALPVNDPNVFDDRYLRALELNYDLIADMNLNETEGFFDSFTRFNNARASQPPTSYSDYSHYINENGDFPNRKLSYQKDEPITNEADIRPDYLNEQSIRRMNSVYDSFSDRGITVVIDFAAVNENALTEIPDYREKAERFEQILRSNAHAAVIGSIADAFYPGGLFYNSDWHLSEEADIQNTFRITTDLQQILNIPTAHSPAS